MSRIQPGKGKQRSMFSVKNQGISNQEHTGKYY